jgi:hypothetical protein
MTPPDDCRPRPLSRTMVAATSTGEHMSAYSVRYYGVSLTEAFEEVQAAVAAALRAEGRTDGPGFDPRWPGEFFLGDYLGELGLGAELYDGGGEGQISYLGFELGDDRGVDDAARARFARMVAEMPAALRGVLAEKLGGDLVVLAAARVEDGND